LLKKYAAVEKIPFYTAFSRHFQQALYQRTPLSHLSTISTPISSAA
jgi:hypothetical protein